jgi:hypothetical protein
MSPQKVKIKKTKQWDLAKSENIIYFNFLGGQFDTKTGLPVSYHCGGWSEEVNSCILISYMVYL